MIGERYWSTGITVEWRYASSGLNGWTAKAEFYDGGWAGDDDPANGRIVTEGVLRTRYPVRDADGSTATLSPVIDAVKADAERLGIEWKDPAIYYPSDGQTDEPPPAGWRDLLRAEASRLGWRCPAANFAGEPQRAQVVTVEPRPLEAVVVNAAEGTTIRVMREGQAREHADKPVPGVPMPVVAVVWPPEFEGAAITRFGGLAGVRNGHHTRDRALWHEAAREAAKRGVVYVAHEQRDWCGRPAWVATGLRFEDCETA